MGSVFLRTKSVLFGLLHTSVRYMKSVFTRAFSRKQVFACLSLFSLANFLAPPSVWAETPPVPTGTAVPGISNLDLSSTTATVPGSSVLGSGQAVIMVSGRPTMVNGAMDLTPAAALAASQVVNAGRQNLTLNSQLAATGGSLILSQSAANVSSMVVPTGVSVLQGLNANVLNIVGNLTNAGTLYLNAGGGGSNLAVNAGSILNSGFIGTLSGTGLNLALNAVNDIVNSGRIVGGGNLGLNAGGTLTNTGSVHAANNVDLSSAAGVINHSGHILSDSGNVSFNNATGNLNVNAFGGTTTAAGAINFRDASFMLKNDLHVEGGNWYSKEFNLNSGCGWAIGSVSDVTGVVNITAGDAHFHADTEELAMGEWTITADPVLTNTGNIDVKSLKPKSGSDYVILAGGSITATTGALAINTSGGGTLNGGNVVLAAGVTFKGTDVTGASASGGNIDLGFFAPGTTVIDTTTSKPNGTGGHVSVIAYSNPTGTFGGNINIPGNIVTTSTGGGANGSVTIVSGATGNATQGQTIQVGDIRTGKDPLAATDGGLNGSGSINIATSKFNGLVKINATTGAILSGTFLGGAPAQGAVSTGTLITNGGAVTITAGRNVNGGPAIQTGTISTDSVVSSNRNGGAVSLTSGVLGGASGLNISVGDISATASGIGRKGGDVSIVSAGGLTLGQISTSGASNASGGNVLVTSPNAFTYQSIAANGATNGGNVSLISGSDITAGAGATINASTSGNGTAGSVLMAAGFNSSVGSTTVGTSTSSTGGNLNLALATGTGINTSAGTNGTAGNVTLLAFRGSVNGTGAYSLSNASINAAGNGTGASGDVTVLAGAVAANVANSINSDAINTAGGQSGSGNVSLLSQQPTAFTLTKSSGAMTGGTTGGALANGIVSVDGDITTTGGDVTITAGTNDVALPAIAINSSINTSTTVGNGGDVTLVSGHTGAGTNGSINVTGSITTAGNDDNNAETIIGNHSGDVRIVSPNSITVTGAINTNDAGTAGTKPQANGGNVILHAGTQTTTGSVTFNTISTQGVSAGTVEIVAAGNVSTTAANSPINASSRDGGVPANDANFGSGGAVTVVAGAFSEIIGETTSIYGAVPNGGTINWSVGGTAIDTSSNAIHGNGGSVRLIAYANGANGGTVSISAPIVTRGSQRMVDKVLGTAVNMWAGAGGDVFVMAGGTGTAGNPFTIDVDSIDTTVPMADLTTVTGSNVKVGGAPGTGFVELLTSTPNTSFANPVNLNNTDGKVTAGSFIGGANVAGAVDAGSITTTGGHLRISAGTNAAGGNAIQTGAITTSIPDASAVSRRDVYGNGGYVTLFAGVTGGGGANINVGNIATQGYTGDGYFTGGLGFTVPDPVFAADGGAVTVITDGSITTGSITTGDSGSTKIGNSNFSGAIGGNVLMLAGTPGLSGGNITVGAISSTGFGGGSVELYTIGTDGLISGSSISTGNYAQAATLRTGGSIAMSSVGGINFTGSMNTSNLGVGVGVAGYVFLSSSGTINVSSISTSAGAGSGIAGFAYAITEGAAISAPGAFTDTTTAEIGGGAPSGAPAGNQDLVTFGITPPIFIANTGGGAPEPLFAPVGGGFTVFNSIDENITIQGPAAHMIVPMVSLSAAGVNVSGGMWSTGMILRFVGSSVNVNTSFPGSAFGPAAVSTGSITFDGNTIYGSMASPTSVSLTATANIMNMTKDVISPTVTISNTQQAGNQGFVQVDGRVLTQNLGVTVNMATPTTSVGTVFGNKILPSNGALFVTSMNTVSGIDAMRISNLSVGSIQLANVGSISIDNAQAISSIGPNGFSYMRFATQATSAQNGSILLHGDIDADLGWLALIANGGIFTTGDRTTTIHATGRTNELGAPAGGNSIVMMAGANFKDVDVAFSNQFTVPGRSGYGGNVSLPGLDPTTPLSSLVVSSDNTGARGNLIIGAYANLSPNNPTVQPGTVSGGEVFIPNDIVARIVNPDRTPTNAILAGQGITIIAEASGGDEPSTTISAGDVTSGVGSLRIGTFTPNINEVNNAVSAVLNLLGDFTTSNNFSFIFSGNVSPNASINVNNLALVGGVGGVQKVQLFSGGDITAGSVRTIGAVGFTPVAPTTFAAFTGGVGGEVTIVGNFNITINGPVYAFGGGGGGGQGDTGTAGGAGQSGGGAGGAGGSGGNVTISSDQGGAILVAGDINTSGGGGGGGGGGFTGVSGSGGSPGGDGGAGGHAGQVRIESKGLNFGTIQITGTIIAAGGGAGGKGGDGSDQGAGNNGYGGGGGGGGGSFGAGGGGGAGGASQPLGKSGFGGAGGGGLQTNAFFGGGGGGGGDVRQASASGNGGFGAGAYLGPVYTTGVGGGQGTGQQAAIPPEQGSSSFGGDGGGYTPVPPIFGVTPFIAQGGDYGQPGQGAVQLNPTVSGNGGNNGFAVGASGLNSGRDGNVILSANTYSTPGQIYGATVLYSTPFGVSEGNIVVTGNHVVTGRFLATPASTLGSAVIQTQQTAGTTGGNITIAPNTRIQVYETLVGSGNGFPSGVVINAANPNATINIGAGSSITSGSGAQNVIYVGTLPTLGNLINITTPVAGALPANVSTVSTTIFALPQFFYGSSGFTAAAPTNVLYALGGFSRIIFEAPTRSQIVLGGGVQIAAFGGTALSSLDLTDNATVDNIVTLQANKVLGGTLLTNGNVANTVATGGTLTVYPFQLQQTISALNIPVKVVTSLLNFSADKPITISSNSSSTTANPTIDGTLQFLATKGVTIAPTLTVFSDSQPSIDIGATGKLTSSNDLNISSAGDVNINGLVSAVSNLNISTQAGSLGDINLTVATSKITGRNITLSTDSLGGHFNATNGSIAATNTVTISTSLLNLPDTGTKTKLSATNTVALNNNSFFGDSISVGGGLGFVISNADITGITAKTVQIGIADNNDGITIFNRLNVDKATALGDFVGAKNLAFVTGGSISAASGFSLGGKNLTIDAEGTVALGPISGGVLVSINGDAGVTVSQAIAIGSAGTLTLSSAGSADIDLNGQTVGGGKVTTISAGGNILDATEPINGKTVNLTANDGFLTPVITNATLLTVNSASGAATINLTAPGVVKLGASSVNGLFTLNFTGAVKNTLEITGVQNHGDDFDVNFTANDSGINLKANITVGGDALFTVPGKGTIVAGVKNLLLTAGGAILQSGTGAIGSSSAPINLNAPVVSAITGGTAAIYLTNNSNVIITGAQAGSTWSMINTAEDITSPSIAVDTTMSAPIVILRATNVTNGSINIDNNITTAGAKTSVTLQGTGFGSVTANSGVAITTQTLNLLSGTGGVDLGTGGASTNAGVLTVNSTGAVSITDTFTPAAGKVILVNNAKATLLDLNFINGGATITAAAKSSIGGLSGLVNGNLIVKDAGTTQVQLGDLTINGNGTFSSPGGFAQQPLSSIAVGGTGTNLILTSTNGSISLDTNFPNVTATITAGTTGSVSINGTAANLTLGKAATGSDYTVTATGNLTVNSIVNRALNTGTLNDVNITTSGGTLTIAGSITTKGGAITINNSNPVGNIVFNPNVKVTTLIASATKAVDPNMAQITVFVGPTFTESNAGSFTGTVTTSVTAPGQIFIGTQAGGVAGPATGKATVTALRADVVFDTVAPGQITLNAGVLIKADPIILTGAAVQAVATIAPAHLTVVTNGNGGVQAAVRQQPMAVPQQAFVAPTTTSIIPTVMATPATTAPTNFPATTIQTAPAEEGVSRPMVMDVNEFVVDTDEEVESTELRAAL
jgi:hypothetical protein